ncbi:protein maelstrom homolog isoform X1 [Anopheles gambiae]|uniref:protein maelstrom homolog isoform X1 n=1 Tax=Anopheles gambiae TaxID=7165 RepID=UPI002AC93CEF|nr:protein maelstrom homolog isoform X1 [Anopheles gambiae]
MPKKNGFFYFMLDYKKREEAKGRKFSGLDQVAPIAGEVWKKMNAQQREPYNVQAKQDVLNTSGGKGKITNIGIPISEITQEKRDRESKAERLKKLVSTLVMNAASKNGMCGGNHRQAERVAHSADTHGRLLSAFLSAVLEKQEFYFISMAYFCRTNTGVHLPAELAVVRYSLEGGVKDKLHMFINPGRLPIGMAYDAQRHAEEDHQLPLPPNAMGVSDYGDVAMRLFSFLLQNDDMPLLFTDETDVPRVESMLEHILSDHLSEIELRICPLAELFFRLKQNVELYMMDQTTFPSVYIAQQIITKDVYDYTKGISCDYHEEKDNVLYCPLSRCIRWAYIISDNCCQDMGIEPIPGKHVPLNANTNPTACTYDLSSFVSAHDDRDSFVSGSNVSRFTNPLTGDSYASSQLPASAGRGAKRFGPGGSSRANSSSSAVRSHFESVEESINTNSSLESSSLESSSQSDDKTELHESLKRSAAWESNSSMAGGSAWGPETKSPASSSFRGAGRGRGQLLEEFPPLAGVGGRGRARRFL